MGYAAYRHFGCRITDDLVYRGMRALFLENDLVRVGVLLDKGTDIFQFLHKPTDTDFLWRSPTGLLDPRRIVATKAAGNGAFLDGYHGGWQEILPGGGPYDHEGAEIGLHGEVTHLAWDYDIIRDTPDEICVEFRVDCLRTPFRIVKRLRMERGNPALFIDEELIHLSPQPQQFMWGHHPAFGAPFLREGVRLFVPAAKAVTHSPRFAASGIFEPGVEFAWPIAAAGDRRVDLSCVPGPDAGYADLIYLEQLSAGWYAVLDPERRVGFGMSWPQEVLPYLWFWLVYGRAPGYPWWDRVYCIALEPWTSAPNSFATAGALGRHAQLAGNASLNLSLAAVAITDREAVSSIQPDGVVK